MSKRGTKSNYNQGIKAENKVKYIYETNGYNVIQSPGSRGAADLKCTRGNITHFVQVKSSNNTTNPYISNGEIGRLKLTSTKNNATPIIAKIGSDNNINIKYARNGLNAHL